MKIIELMQRLGEAVKANPTIAERNVVIEARDRRKIYTTDIGVNFDDNGDFVVYEIAGSKAY